MTHSCLGATFRRTLPLRLPPPRLMMPAARRIQRRQSRGAGNVRDTNDSYTGLANIVKAGRRQVTVSCSLLFAHASNANLGHCKDCHVWSAREGKNIFIGKSALNGCARRSVRGLPGLSEARELRKPTAHHSSHPTGRSAVTGILHASHVSVEANPLIADGSLSRLSLLRE